MVLQRMAVLQAVGRVDEADDPTPDPDPDLARLAALARDLPADETQLLYSLCLHGRAELGLAPDEYAALTMVLLRLLPFKSSVAQGGAVAPPKKPPSESSDRPAPTQARAPTPEQARPPARIQPPPAASARPPTDSTLVAPPDPPVGPASAVQAGDAPAPDLGSIWGKWVQRLLAGEHVAGLARELALQSQLVLQDAGAWSLQVEQQALQHAGASDQLLQALRNLGEGAPERLLLTLGPVIDSHALRLAAAQAQRQRQAEEIIEGDPFVQEMMRLWGARIVPGSIKPWSAAAGKTL